MFITHLQIGYIGFITNAFQLIKNLNLICRKMLIKKILSFKHSTLKVPIIDVTRYLRGEPGWQKDCQDVSNALRKYGLLIIKDPRVSQQQNDNFIDLMEKYFLRRSQQYNQGNRTIDYSPQTNFRVGIMHQYQQKFQAYKEQKQALKHPHQSLTPEKGGRDPKWRFHWKVDYPKNVIPKDFPGFQSKMNTWGRLMKNGCLVTSEMAAIGLGIQKDFLSKTVINSNFMLSPTAVDLVKNKTGDVLAAFHRDFDLLTIHGKARFPGLYAWLNTGEKFLVSVPQGHLLVQAGKQIEWLTGGQIKAGFHEVIYTEEVEKKKQIAISQGRIPWRISSLMFCHVEDSVILQPHPKFAVGQAKNLYKRIKAEDYLNNELYYLTDVV